MMGGFVSAFEHNRTKDVPSSEKNIPEFCKYQKINLVEKITVFLFSVKLAQNVKNTMTLCHKKGLLAFSRPIVVDAP